MTVERLDLFVLVGDLLRSTMAKLLVVSFSFSSMLNICSSAPPLYLFGLLGLFVSGKLLKDSS